MASLAKINLINYAILIVGALAMVVPFIWMLSTSFKPRAETMLFPPTLLPSKPVITNYVNVFNRLDIGRLYLNTFYVSVIKTVVMVYTSALLGYVFGKFKFKGRDLIFYGILSAMIIPFQVYMIPLYIMMVNVKMADTHLALIVPYLFSAYAIFLFRQFMYTIPNELIDAARVDGAGEWYIFNAIVLPLCKSAVFMQIGFYFMWNWNDFLWPLIVITSGQKNMLAVGLAVLVNDRGNDYGLIMAGATLAIIPVLVVFMFVQKYIVQGIAITGMKG
jgi:multiple sugar transport system permease protein